MKKYIFLIIFVFQSLCCFAADIDDLDYEARKTNDRLNSIEYTLSGLESDLSDLESELYDIRKDIKELGTMLYSIMDFIEELKNIIDD